MNIHNMIYQRSVRVKICMKNFRLCMLYNILLSYTNIYCHTNSILGGIGTVLEWWPIKAYRPCPNFVERVSETERFQQVCASTWTFCVCEYIASLVLLNNLVLLQGGRYVRSGQGLDEIAFGRDSTFQSDN